MAKNPDDELIGLLNSDIPYEIKIKGLEYILGLTGSSEGITVLLTEKYIKCLCGLIDVNNEKTVAITLQCLVNLSGEDEFLVTLESLENRLIESVTKMIYSSSEDLYKNALMFLVNVTRFSSICRKVLNTLTENGGLKKFIYLLNNGKPESNYHLMAPVLCNLSTLTETRKIILNENEKLIKNLLAYTVYPQSETRRLGIVGTIKNCCFETEYHDFLLSDEIDILPSLMLPLAGPEEFDDEDNEKLPLELQYLGEEKTRDPNPKIRIQLIEALNQLCATKKGRNILKDKQVYIILRELHKWEKERNVVVACENVVDILISDEPPQELENLKEIDIPNDLAEKFEKINEDLLNLDVD